MGVRDDEIKRLTKYAQALGCKVVYRRHKRWDPGATWDVDSGTPIITLYTWPRQSKTRLIMNFLHELGHHLDWIDRGKITKPALERALEEDNMRINRYDKPIAKHLRKLIYLNELAGIKFMIHIYEELLLTIPKWKVLMEMEFDIWIYKQYYEVGVCPTEKESKAHLKKLKRKFKNVKR